MAGHAKMVSIWFFIGLLLLTYGVLILGAGIWGVYHPYPVKLAELNAGVWWGVLLLIIGAVYIVKFRPRAQKKG
jgi:hypothetical protein